MQDETEGKPKFGPEALSWMPSLIGGGKVMSMALIPSSVFVTAEPISEVLASGAELRREEIVNV